MLRRRGICRNLAHLRIAFSGAHFCFTRSRVICHAFFAVSR